MKFFRVVFTTFLFFCFFQTLNAQPIRRNKRFLRPLAMGQAFTAVGDGASSISYNPAGLKQKGKNWNAYLELFKLTISELIRDNINSEGSSASNPVTQEEYEETYLGERVYFELETGFPFGAAVQGEYDPAADDNSFNQALLNYTPTIYLPDLGFYSGSSYRAWADLAFPDQAILPIVETEYVKEKSVHYGYSMDFFDESLFLGLTVKGIVRDGFIADVSVFRYYAYEDDESFDEILQDLEEEFGEDNKGTQWSGDIGAIYKFGGDWNPRVGLSIMNLGGIDFGGVGEEKQFISTGFAVSPSYGQFRYTLSIDYLDAGYTYFNHSSTLRRIALGGEVAFGIRDDANYYISLLGGIRNKQPSYGAKIIFGVFEFGVAVWVEDFGTDQTPQLDERIMYQLGFMF